MIEIKQSIGAFTPQTAEESNGEIIGRCNALHDWAMAEARLQYGLSRDLMTVCILMGFTDVIAAHKANVESEEK